MEANYQDMPGLYRASDLFTLPSWDREAFGIVYLEALASNIPVVAPQDSSRKEIVGDAGILVDTSNCVSYAQAISETLSQNWGNKPRLQAQKFSWDEVAGKYEALFEEMMR